MNNPRFNKLAYPGAAPELPGVRLPSLPEGVRPYRPPMNDAAPSTGQTPGVPLGVALDYEAYTAEIAFSRGVESIVYQTHSRWRALDVFVSFDPTILSTIIVSIFVYAVSASGAKALVASGRVTSNQLQVDPAVWVAAARSSTTKYVVTVKSSQPSASAVPDANMSITCVAVDEMTEPRDADQIGQLTASGTTFVRWKAPGGLPQPRALEVVKVWGLNTVAAPDARYLQLWDTIANQTSQLGSVAGRLVQVWPLGAGDGSGAFDSDVFYRCGQASGDPGPEAGFAPFLTVSSTPLTFTNAGGDGACGMTVR